MERFPIHAQMEVRQAQGKRKIMGYAAVFNSLSGDLGGFREQIAPGAFQESLAGDVRALWNHDTGIVLGRTTAGTLRIAEDSVGLRIEIDPPAFADAYVESIQRGDVDQMSFGFQVEKDTWTTVNGQSVRTLQRVRLLEVSPVTFPAYPATTVSARAMYGDIPALPAEQNGGAASEVSSTDREIAAAHRQRQLQLRKARTSWQR